MPKRIAAEHWAEVLGRDLCELLDSADRSLPVEVTPITTLHSSGNAPSSFLLRFADGTLLKGKRLPSTSAANDLTSLLRLLDCQQFPDVIGQNASAVLFEWIEGDVLEGCMCEEQDLKEWGRFHAKLHSRAIPVELVESKWIEVSRVWQQLCADLRSLCEEGLLERREKERALNLSRKQIPEVLEFGTIHGDLCPENIVVSRSGRVFVVDNETVRIGVPEFDLARTWYRWPMSRSEREAYMAGYSEVRRRVDFEDCSLFWSIRVLAEASLFRWSRRTKRADLPLTLLRSILNRNEDLLHTDRSCC